MDERQIHAMCAQGWSGRAIARELGVDRGRVQRLLAASRRAAAATLDTGAEEAELDDDAALLALDAVAGDDPPPVGSVRFVGVDASRVEQFSDEAGRPWDLLGLYRATRCGSAFHDARKQLEAVGRL
jgi:hypothetical protein